jgi:hypothetical protein
MRFPKEAVLEIIRETPPQGSEDAPVPWRVPEQTSGPLPVPERTPAQEAELSKVLASLEGLVGAGENAAELVQASKDERETFEALFGKKVREIRESGSASAAVALAREMLEAGRVSGNQPGFLTLVLFAAWELGNKDPTGYGIAIDAMCLLRDRVPAQAEACDRRLIVTYSRQYARASGQERELLARELITMLLSVANARARVCDFDTASALGQQALSIAVCINSQRRESIESGLRLIKARREALERIKKQHALVDANPDDAPAAEELLRLCLGELDSPSEAAKHLDVIRDERAKRNIILANTTIGRLPEAACLELGDWYRALAEKAGPQARAVMLRRAQEYYSAYLQRHVTDDLDRSKARIASRQVEESLAQATREGGTAMGAAGLTPTDTDAHFEKAKQTFEQAIADAQKAFAGIPADDWKTRADARLQILTSRAELANMIFQNWLKNDLDLLEVTDCRGGDREKVARLLQTAEHQYRAAFQGSIEWQSEIDRDPNRNQYVNAGYTRRLRDIQRDAQYYAAWTAYYRAWVLPKDYKPPQGGRSREELLNDAITAFQSYRDLPDTVPAKWYAFLVAGLAQRELGKYEDALTSLANADNASAPETLKIRVAFEIALTRVRQGKCKEARKAIENAREFFGAPKISQNLYGLALPIVEAESYIAEAKATNAPALKDKGVEILKALNQRGPPWPAIVSFVMPTFAGAPENVGQMDPFPDDEVADMIEVHEVIGVGGGRKDLGGFDGLGTGSSRGSGFFGAGGGDEKVRKIVYIVDRSGSMTDSIDYVKFELKRSIGELSEEKEFHVIFYSSGPPVEMPAGQLVKATDRNKQLAFEFIDGVRPEGETDPSKALERAFEVKPELIYLLTDGEFDHAIVGLVKRQNVGGKVIVHTIGFLYRTGEQVLKQIAEQNGGNYKLVSEKDLATLIQ